MQVTTNLGLKKPDVTDIFNISHQNDNMDILDKEIQVVSMLSIYLNTETSLPASGAAIASRVIPLTGIRRGVGNGFRQTADGGIECLRSGVIMVSAMSRVGSVPVNGQIGITYGKKKVGTTTISADYYQYYNGANTARSTSAVYPSMPSKVDAGDIIYLIVSAGNSSTTGNIAVGTALTCQYISYD